MKMHKLVTFVTLLSTITLMTSCGDSFLTSRSTEKPLAGADATEKYILSSLGSAYQILLLDSYANNSYQALFVVFDLRSDDLFKGGGDAGDQSALYSLSLFSMSAAESLTGLWRIYYTGLARCNSTIMACKNAVGVDEPLSEPYLAKQLTSDEVYTKIMDNIEVASVEGAMAMDNNTGVNQGRACRAAALMLKARVVMYQKDQNKYAEVAQDIYLEAIDRPSYLNTPY